MCYLETIIDGKKKSLTASTSVFFFERFFPPLIPSQFSGLLADLSKTFHSCFDASSYTFPSMTLCAVMSHIDGGWMVVVVPPPLHTHRVRFPMFVGREGGFPFQHVWLVNISLASKVIQWKTGGIFFRPCYRSVSDNVLTIYLAPYWFFLKSPNIYSCFFIVYI